MRSKRNPSVLIGVAGWTIPARFKSSFPGDGTHLLRYARTLNAVEINTSFKQSHSRATYERWATSVPREFRFSVKVPHAFTHESELHPSKTELDAFVDAVTGLGARLGALLVQLPPSQEFKLARARAFFGKLRDRVSCAVVCEPRHQSWSSEKAEALMTEYRVSRVAADPPPWEGASAPSGSREITYFRLHGSPRRYYSDYPAEQLQLIRARIDAACQESKQVWCIFDNTALGCATGNALELSRLREE
jgi:uncharacterized protein YecE (DUF72 family)